MHGRESMLAQANISLQDFLGVSVIIKGLDNLAGYSCNQLLSNHRANAMLDLSLTNGIKKTFSIGRQLLNHRIELCIIGIAFIMQENKFKLFKLFYFCLSVRKRKPCATKTCHINCITSNVISNFLTLATNHRH